MITNSSPTQHTWTLLTTTRSVPTRCVSFEDAPESDSLKVPCLDRGPISERVSEAIKSLVVAIVFVSSFAAIGFSQDKPAASDTDASTDQASAAQATPAKKPPVTVNEVRKLMRALESNQLQERDAAEQSLVELGPAVLAFLPEVGPNTSGEMKVRLQRIREQLQVAKSETYFEASTVTLSGKMKLTEAIAEIEKQSGNKIMLEGAEAFDSMMIELDAKDQPFWDVMAKVMSQSNLRINNYTTSDALSLVASSAESSKTEGPPPTISGPFRIEVISVQSSLAFASRLGGQLDLSLQVAWEPRLKPVFMQVPMSSMSAKLSDESTLPSANPQSVPEVPLNSGGSSTQIDLQLERPARSVTKLEKLNGEFTIAVPSEKHKYVFEKFGNGARQSEKFGDVAVTLEGARRNGAVFEMRIMVEFGNPQGALDSFRGWILSNEAYLLDPKERRLENVGLQTYAVTPNAVGIAYLFQINGNPDEFKLIYESPGLITRETVKFELSDIELP